MALSGSRTNPDRVAARFRLKPGCKYEDAVKTFQPYDQTKEVNTAASQAGAPLIREGTTTTEGQACIYVNNRLERKALATIVAMPPSG